MARTLDQVCERYERNLRNGRMILGRANTVEEQVARFRAAREHAGDLEARSGEVLVALEMPSIQWPFYYAMVRRLDRLTRQEITGESIALEAGLLVDNWVRRGLVRDALVALCRQVLNIEPAYGGWTQSQTDLE
jgi:hypothetical protein